MKIRVLFTLDCHNNCSYCCNKIPEQRERFLSLPMRYLEALIETGQVSQVSVSGGEPLMNMRLIREVRKFAELLLFNGVPSYLYTALPEIAITPDGKLAMSIFTGVNIGVHPTQLPITLLMERYMQLPQCIRDKTLLRPEDKFTRGKNSPFRGIQHKAWTRNDCTDDDEIIFVVSR